MKNLRYPKSINIGDLIVDDIVVHDSTPGSTLSILLEKKWEPIGLFYTAKLLRPDGSTRECTWPSTWKIEVVSEGW